MTTDELRDRLATPSPKPEHVEKAREVLQPISDRIGNILGSGESPQMEAIAEALNDLENSIALAISDAAKVPKGYARLELAARDVISSIDGHCHDCDDPEDGCAEAWSDRVTELRAALSSLPAARKEAL